MSLIANMPIDITGIILEASFWIMFAALIATLAHLYKGPMILDRVNALNMLGNLLVSVSLVIALIFRDKLFLEISLALCLAGFIPIVAMTHFLVRRYGK